MPRKRLPGRGPPPRIIPVTEHHDYALLWDLSDEMAKQDGKTPEASWRTILDAFWEDELPALFVFTRRRGGAPGRELMALPSRDVLAGHLLGKVEQVNDESADPAELSHWIAELHGWTLQDYQRQPEPFSTFVARDPDALFGVAIRCTDFERWRAKPQKGRGQTLPPQPSGGPGEKPKRRPGPDPGELRRYEAADRALFPELEQIMNTQHKSRSAAARVLAEAGKIAGNGTQESVARRLAALYSSERRTRN
jgi:hypothetical protein